MVIMPQNATLIMPFNTYFCVGRISVPGLISIRNLTGRETGNWNEQRYLYLNAA